MKRTLLLIALFFTLVTVAHAQSVTFPVAELGNCTSSDNCRAYCDAGGHETACLDFAQKHKLMSSTEVSQARKLLGETGPGNCKGLECKTYCENAAHVDECVDFAVKQGFVSAADASKIKQFKKLVSSGGGPGGCQGEACKQYCENSAHQSECFDFAKKNGLIPKDQVARIEQDQKIRQKIQTTGGPGSCKSASECLKYCNDAAHVEECITFASATTGMTLDQARAKVKEFTQQVHQFNQDNQMTGDQNFQDQGMMNDVQMPDEATMSKQFQQFQQEFQHQDNGQFSQQDHQGDHNFQDGMNNQNGDHHFGSTTGPQGFESTTNGQFQGHGQNNMMPQFKTEAERQQFMKDHMPLPQGTPGQFPNPSQSPVSGSDNSAPQMQNRTPNMTAEEMLKMMQHNMQNMTPEMKSRMPADMQNPTLDQVKQMMQQHGNFPQGQNNQGQGQPPQNQGSMNPQGGQQQNPPQFQNGQMNNGQQPSGGQNQPPAPASQNPPPHASNALLHFTASIYNAFRELIFGN